jgi:superfamily I DNA/RNA helicase
MIAFNEQQQAVIHAFPNVSLDRPLVVKARAGTGKTSTIEGGFRKNLQSRILLLCFNKSIADAAKARMPANVTAKTFAGLTWNTPMFDPVKRCDSTYGRVYGHRVNWRFYTSKFANLLRVEDTVIHAARATLNYFVATKDKYIGKHHVQKLLWMGKPKEEQEGFKDEVVTVSRKLWAMKLNPRDKSMPVNWNDITKMVQVEGDARHLGQYEYVVVDEAQDITACVFDIIQQMRCPTILVGDDFQRLYAFIYTINSLDELSNEPMYLTESHRFDQNLADQANTVLDLLNHQTPKLKGVGKPTSINYAEPTGAHTVLCRTNTGLLAEALKAIRNNKKIHVMGNLMDSVQQLESGYYLSIGQTEKVTHPSLIGMKDWTEVEALKEHDTDLAVLFRQVNTYGNQIPHFCEELETAGEVAECKADVVLSTVHKAKGREWSHVRLNNDFPKLVYFSENERKYKVKKFEVYTLYVALTRAQSVLYPNDVLGLCKGWKELL